MDRDGCKPEPLARDKLISNKMRERQNTKLKKEEEDQTRDTRANQTDSANVAQQKQFQGNGIQAIIKSQRSERRRTTRTKKEQKQSPLGMDCSR